MSDVPTMFDKVDHLEVETIPTRGAHVYGWTVRLWHWVLVGSMIVLAVTGWFIGRPLTSVGGEAGDIYTMGWIRVVHFTAAYIFAISWIARFYFAIANVEGGRDLFTLPFWTKEYWADIWHEMKFYAFITQEFHPQKGHNALAKTSYVIVFVLGSLFMIFTGFAMYGEALGSGSWADVMFGWVIPWFGQSQTVHMVHRLGMWVLGIFAMMHVYMVFREELASCQSSLSTMISGYRYYRGRSKK